MHDQEKGAFLPTARQSLCARGVDLPRTTWPEYAIVVGNKWFRRNAASAEESITT